jgi:hypothetical protein
MVVQFFGHVEVTDVGSGAVETAGNRDGHFAEAKEAVDGFALVEVRSKEEAVELGPPLPEDRRRRGERDPAGIRSMTDPSMMDVGRTVQAVWKLESARIIAGLTRIVHDVGRAEEFAQAAPVSALVQWPETGVPDNPDAWPMTTAKRRAIDDIPRAEHPRGCTAASGRCPHRPNDS